MPHSSDKKRALKDIEHAAQVIAGYIALARPRGKKEWRILEVLCDTHAIISQIDDPVLELDDIKVRSLIISSMSSLRVMVLTLGLLPHIASS